MKEVSIWKRYIVQCGWRYREVPRWTTVESFRTLGAAKRYARYHRRYSTLNYRVLDTKPPKEFRGNPNPKFPPRTKAQ